MPQGELLERARRVIGFNSVEPAVRVPSGLDIRHGVTFAVRTKRRDKQFPFTSPGRMSRWRWRSTARRRICPSNGFPV